jgi:hypothetical protein
VYEGNTPAGSWTDSGGSILVQGLTPDRDYTVYAAPYVDIGGERLYMKAPGTLAYYVTPRRALPTAAMSNVTVAKGAPQGKGGVTYPGAFSITLEGGSQPGIYALDRARSDEFAAWWANNHGDSSAFNTTGCFRFTLSGGKVAKIDLQNDSSLSLNGKAIKVNNFDGLTEVVMGGLSSGNGSLSVDRVPRFTIPASAGKTFKGVIEIGYDVEYRNEHQDIWGGIASGSTLRLKWGSTVYLTGGSSAPFIAPDWKAIAGSGIFIWEGSTVSNGSVVELKEDSVRVEGKITAIKPYTLTETWTVTGGSVLTIAIGGGNTFEVGSFRIQGSHGALPIANSNIKHRSGTIRNLNRADNTRRDVTVSSECIYNWSGSASSGGWVF